jgi:hypothetical protein
MPAFQYHDLNISSTGFATSAGRWYELHPIQIVQPEKDRTLILLVRQRNQQDRSLDREGDWEK